MNFWHCLLLFISHMLIKQSQFKLDKYVLIFKFN